MFSFLCYMSLIFFFSSRRRHTRCALVTGVQTCALPISVTVRMLAEALKLENDARMRFVDASRQQDVATVTPRPRLPVPANNLIGRAPELAEAVDRKSVV